MQMELAYLQVCTHTIERIIDWSNNFNQEESENAKQIRRAVMQMASRREEEERNRPAELMSLKMEKPLS